MLKIMKFLCYFSLFVNSWMVPQVIIFFAFDIYVIFTFRKLMNGSSGDKLVASDTWKMELILDSY